MEERITPDKDEEAAPTSLALQGVGRLFGIRALSKHSTRTVWPLQAWMIPCGRNVDAHVGPYYVVSSHREQRQGREQGRRGGGRDKHNG